MIIDRKDFLELKDLSAEEIIYILKTAETMKFVLSQKGRNSPMLRGKSVISLFYETSDRARLAYELAAQHLSAAFADINLSSSNGRETLKDMGIMLDQMGADFIIIRHSQAGAANILAKNVKASVINAGDGYNENPGQTLLDLMTIKEYKKDFKGLKVAIIGDLLHSRVNKGNIWALTKLGSEVVISGPPALVPEEIENFGVKVFYNACDAVKDADVILSGRINVDDLEENALPSMEEYKNFFMIDKELLSYAKDDAIVMHPGPIKRGIEISSEVMDSPQCIVSDQLSNSISVRMAMLYILAQGRKS